MAKTNLNSAIERTWRFRWQRVFIALHECVDIYNYQYNDITNDARDNASIEISKYYKHCNESVTSKSKFSNIWYPHFHAFNY